MPWPGHSHILVDYTSRSLPFRYILKAQRTGKSFKLETKIAFQLNDVHLIDARKPLTWTVLLQFVTFSLTHGFNPFLQM